MSSPPLPCPHRRKESAWGIYGVSLCPLQPPKGLLAHWPHPNRACRQCLFGLRDPLPKRFRHQARRVALPTGQNPKACRLSLQNPKLVPNIIDACGAYSLLRVHLARIDAGLWSQRSLACFFDAFKIAVIHSAGAYSTGTLPSGLLI